MKYLLITIMLLLAGCCSTMEETAGVITVTSIPTNATILLNGIERGHTPAVVHINRDETQNFLLKHAGYNDTKYIVKQVLSHYFFGNILIWGILGMIFDGLTGKATVIAKKKIHVDMKPNKKEK